MITLTPSSIFASMAKNLLLKTDRAEISPTSTLLVHLVDKMKYEIHLNPSNHFH